MPKINQSMCDSMCKNEWIPESKLAVDWAQDDSIRCFFPVGERLLVRLLTLENVTSSGFYIPKEITEKGKISFGYIVKIGNRLIGEANKDMNKEGNKQVSLCDFQIDDCIIFQKWSAIEISEGSKLVFVKLADVIACMRCPKTYDDK